MLQRKLHVHSTSRNCLFLNAAHPTTTNLAVSVRHATPIDYWAAAEVHVSAFHTNRLPVLCDFAKLERLDDIIRAVNNNSLPNRSSRYTCLVAECDSVEDGGVFYTTESLLAKAVGSCFYSNAVQLGITESTSKIHGVINLDTKGSRIPNLAIINGDGTVQKRRPQGCAYLSNLSVRPEFRRRGIGRRLIKEAEFIAQQWGCWGAALHVDRINTEAYALYLKCFETVFIMIRHLRIACYELIAPTRRFKSTTVSSFELKLESECEDYLDRRRSWTEPAPLEVETECKVAKSEVEDSLSVLSLFKDVEMSREKREQIITRFPEILKITNSEIENLMLRFLQLGMKRSSIYEILLNYPEIFSFKFEYEIQPIIKYFSEMLRSHTSAVDLLSQSPVVMTYSLELEIKPKVEYFEKLGLSPTEVKEIVIGYPSVLALSVKRSIQPKLDYLKTRLPELDIKSTILRFPGFLDMSLEAHIKEKVEYFLDVLQVNEMQFAKYLPYFPEIFSCEIETNIQMKIEVLCLKMGVVDGRGKKFRIAKRENLSFMSCVPLFGLSKLQLLERIEHLSYIVYKNNEIMDYLFGKCPLLFGCSVEDEELTRSSNLIKEVLSFNRSHFLRVISGNPEILLNTEDDLKRTVEKMEGAKIEEIIQKLTIEYKY
eukprot:g7162.t1